MSFEPIKRVLHRSVQSAPLAKELQIARVFDAWASVLTAAWGAERAAFVAPISFREGSLTVESRSASALQQIRTDNVRLLNDMNRILGGRVVHAIDARSKGF